MIKHIWKPCRRMMTDNGVTVPLVTSDGPFEENLNGGTTGRNPSHRKLRIQDKRAVSDPFTNIPSGGPLMCTEFWVGWFDHWGNGGHMTGNLEESVKDLDDMLSMGHVNIYMFEGGTNFGFMNGANYYDELTPDVTSYDYDAVLTEDGRITEKYRRYRDVIAKYAKIPEVSFPQRSNGREYGVLTVQDKVSLFSVLDQLSQPVSSVYPVSMERLGQNYGYILYRTTLRTEESLEKIRLWGANDRANLFADKKAGAHTRMTESSWRNIPLRMPMIGFWHREKRRSWIFWWKIWAVSILVRGWSSREKELTTAFRSTVTCITDGKFIRFLWTVWISWIFPVNIWRIPRPFIGLSWK